MKDYLNRIRIEQVYEIKENVRDAKFKEAFEGLTQLIDSGHKSLYHQTTILSSRYHEWKQRDVIGTNPPISEFNKIISDLLYVLDELGEEITKSRYDELHGNLNRASIINGFQSHAITLNNLSALFDSCEKSLLQSISLDTYRVKVWLALLPQLKGTITTLFKLMNELVDILKVEELVYEITGLGLKADVKILDYKPKIQKDDINHFNNMYLSLKSIIRDKFDSNETS